MLILPIDHPLSDQSERKISAVSLCSLSKTFFIQFTQSNLNICAAKSSEIADKVVTCNYQGGGSEEEFYAEYWPGKVQFNAVFVKVAVPAKVTVAKISPEFSF